MSLFSKKLRLLHVALPIVLILIFFSLTGRSFRRAPWYEEAFWNILSPPQRALSIIGSSVSGVWNHYVMLVRVSKENEDLKAKLGEFERERAAGAEAVEENKRLKALLGYKGAFPQESVTARVIANDPRAEFKSVMIDVGSSDGVTPLMPVIGSRGLVGKVGRVGINFSVVLLVIDPNSAVDVMIQRSRARGMVVGAAWKTELKAGYYLTRLEYLRRVSDIRDGDVAVTSGLDGVFPPGIPVGTVHDLKTSRYGVFRDANVVPFEEMAEIQEVLVLRNRPVQTASQ